MARTDSAKNRLLGKVARNDECWEWTAYKDRDGYGRFGKDGKIWLAHRASFELFVGPIPEGLEIDHLCRNRACVNPAHLEPVPRVVNWLRGESPSVRHRFATCCAYGHLFDEPNTYFTADGRRMCRKCTARRQREYQARKRAAA